MRTYHSKLLVLMTVLSGIWCVQASGSLYISSLENAPVSAADIGSDAWMAQPFGTGYNPEGYRLDLIQLRMNPGSGDPSGFTVSINSNLGDDPDYILGYLSGPDPASGGVLTYTASDIILAPRNLYYVVVSGDTPAAQESYSWSISDSGYSYNNDWAYVYLHMSSPDGSAWSNVTRQGIFQLAIHATPVPEPSVLALVGLGAACLGLLGRFRSMGTRLYCEGG